MPSSLRSTCALFVVFLFSCLPSSAAQEAGRTKLAEGEYRVTLEGDLGCGPIETEVFHFSESWTLRRTAVGDDLEGHRIYESPRDQVHDDRFVALAPDLQLLSTKAFARLTFRRDSGPLTCELLPQQLCCDSGAKDPAQSVDVQFAMDRPYGLIWPLSAFSLSGLTRAASSQLNKATPIQVVQLQEISNTLPVLAIRSDGLTPISARARLVLQCRGKAGAQVSMSSLRAPYAR